MYCIINIGMTGQGKSRFIKQYIAGRACHVFDVQNEYNDLSLNTSSLRSRNVTLNEKQFIAECSKMKGRVCVFEEATGFFEGKTDRELRRLVLSKRHSRNVYIFCFHSISSVPPRLMQLCNFVVLFKTADEPYQVETKYPTLLPYFMKLKKLPLYSLLTIKMIPQ